jgi:cell division septum initiation protein DivIVA
VLKVYGEQQDFLWVYEAQLERWQQESLSDEQRQQTEQMAAQLAQLKPGLSEILAIANDLKDKTIESVLGKSDAELALDVLSGKLKPPF